MCPNGNFRNLHVGQGSKSYSSSDQHFTWLAASIFCKIKQKKKLQNYRILAGFFNIATHTLSVKQSTKLMISSEKTPQCLTEFHDGFKKTHSQHCKSSFWYPVTLASVSTPLFKQRWRKRGEENCRSDRRSRDTSYREISLTGNEKQGENFVETPPT